MALPDTARQYLPDLEERWGIPRKRIVEYAREEKLDLWVDIFDVVFFAYKKESGRDKSEYANGVELKFHLRSLDHLCKNINLSKYRYTMQDGGGHSADLINGILKDGREVIVGHRQPVIQMGPKKTPTEIWVEYSQVYARIEDVKDFERKFLDDDEEEEGVPSWKLLFLDPHHEFYSEELAIAVKAWLKLYGEGGTYQQNQAHKKQIEALLNGKELSYEAIKRISTLVNPKKKGGAPPSGP
jgi:hypothetical protein